MKKLLIIMTGGTIGSTDNNGIISVSQNTSVITERFKRQNPDFDVEFVTESPYTILSENLTVSCWECLINSVLSRDLSPFEGIIITHGSDTLSYTSAMMGLCLHGLSVPVVITAADYVPDDPRSNADVNFKAAVQLALKMESGVYTVYKNKNSPKPQLFIPTRICEADRIADIFTSADKNISANGNLVYLSMLRKVKKENIPADIKFTKRVVIVHPYPSINYGSISLDDNTGAVLHVTYHSGTVSEEASALLDKCRKRNIPFFLCSLKSSSKSLYETGNRLIELGAIPLYDINTESAYAKLLLALNLFPDNIREFMSKDIYFENIK